MKFFYIKRLMSQRGVIFAVKSKKRNTIKKSMKNVHFIAIGGAAMHNLALALSEKPGYKVTGSDDEIFEPSRSRLEAAGLLPKAWGWFPEKITADTDAVIVGMHAREDNPELKKAKELGVKIYSFPEYLYEQTKGKTRIVVGGSHGKTTTTAMILHVLKEVGVKADYMVGAQIEGFKNMVSLSEDARYAVFEGDEYLTSPLDSRSKFLHYHPHVAVLTGIAWDHVNVFPTFEGYVDTFRKFTQLIEPNGQFIYYAGDENLRKLAMELRQDVKKVAYDTPRHTIKNGVTEVEHGGGGTTLRVFGTHNLQNLMAARAACMAIGVKEDDFWKAAGTFTGAAGRLQEVCRSESGVAYKDFAHSPSKLKATVHAVREQWRNKRLVAVMELHTFSSLTKDFLPQYHGGMDEADVAMVYYNPKVMEEKRMAAFSVADVEKAFGGSVRAFDDSEELKRVLRRMAPMEDTALLLMTSGNFNGVNLVEFAKELLTKNN